MGLARSHVRDLLGREEDWTDGRSHRMPTDDAGLLAELRQEIAQLPSMRAVWRYRAATYAGVLMAWKSSATRARL